MNEENNTKDKEELVKFLRKTIYMKESLNLHKKNPKKDSEMVEEIIKAIRRVVDEEGIEQ